MQSTYIVENHETIKYGSWSFFAWGTRIRQQYKHCDQTISPKREKVDAIVSSLDGV
jgi:hypothetical protein